MASQDRRIHSCEECVPKGSDYFHLTHKKKKLEKRRWEQLKIKLLPSKEDPSINEEYEEARLIRREEKMGANEDQVLTIQRRSLKR